MNGIELKASKNVFPIGLGCMNLSHAYGQPPTEQEAIKVVHRALDLGVNHFDTAALYGFGANERLMGRALKGKREQVFLASKCGVTGVDGKRVMDGRPATLKQTLEQSLQSLDTDVLDLYYLHRWDKKVPIEESVGALGDLVTAGKVRAIGLSEVSAETLQKAHATHPISAVQSEYSLWSRNVEIKVLELCREIGAALVAFSPLGRGFLTGSITDPEDFTAKDIRRSMPRFQQPHFDANRALLPELAAMEQEMGAAPGQLALSWLLHQGEHVLPIPGTTSLSHLEANVQAAHLQLDDAALARLDALINQHTVSGPRYAAATQAVIDTEEFG